MKTLLLSISLLVLVGCGKNNIDPQLQPYVDSFVQLGNVSSPLTPNGLSVQFGTIPDTSAEFDGYCQWGPTGNNTITINQSTWVNYDETQRTLIMYHELGHCVLGRWHNNSLDPVTGAPMSIMYYSATQASVQYQINSAPYIQELFNPAP
jgi:hypothetical protein